MVLFRYPVFCYQRESSRREYFERDLKPFKQYSGINCFCNWFLHDFKYRRGPIVTGFSSTYFWFWMSNLSPHGLSSRTYRGEDALYIAREGCLKEFLRRPPSCPADGRILRRKIPNGKCLPFSFFFLFSSSFSSYLSLFSMIQVKSNMMMHVKYKA